MDEITEIKARLPIEQLVAQYCDIKKKGRNLVCLCPFHNDSDPSLIISPDKGIAYCFSCQSGGDIFSFYQQIEGVDFSTSVRELADKVGIELKKDPALSSHTKSEKDRLRNALSLGQEYFRASYRESAEAQEYMKQRGMPPEMVESFGVGFAPAGQHQLYDALLKKGASKQEIVGAGLASESDLRQGSVIDRFRSRIMFPIEDIQGRLIGFGGRLLGKSDAPKYLNSAETLLYKKSSVLFGFAKAKEAMRNTRRALLVEGYFDVLACHMAGCQEAVATCGTALTEEHARLLKRTVDTVVLCMDQDRAGRDAAYRASTILLAEGMFVEVAPLPSKDPADVLLENPDALKALLGQTETYIDWLMKDSVAEIEESPQQKRLVVNRITTVIQSIPSFTERDDALRKAAGYLGISVESLREDMRRQSASVPRRIEREQKKADSSPFSTLEIAMSMLLLYPGQREAIHKIPEPEGEFSLAVWNALRAVDENQNLTLDTVLPHMQNQEHAQKLRLLVLYAEENGFQNFGQMAGKEIERNIELAIIGAMQKKIRSIREKMLDAKKRGDTDTMVQLSQEMAFLTKKAAEKQSTPA